MFSSRTSNTIAHPIVGAVAGVVLVAALVPILDLWDGSSGPLAQSIPLFFLVPVLLTATLAGRGAGVLVAVVAIAVWDWFFIPPLHQVTIASVRDVMALIVFLAVAVLTGQLATVARSSTREALRRARSSEALYDLSVALIGRRDLSEVLHTLAERLQTTFDLEACAVLLREEASTGWNTVALAGVLPQDLMVEKSRDMASTATWVARQGRRCGLGQGPPTEIPHAAKNRVQLLPLRMGSRSVGVLEIIYRVGDEPNDERQQLLETMANGVALALEQDRLFKEEREADLARESERLKTALLSSVSHDLRTPLAGIKAAASSLLQDDVEWGAEDQRAFLHDIDSEADRLTRLVSNLLDLSRIEAGALKPAREWEDVGELVNRVVQRLRPWLNDHPLVTEIPDSLPPVRLDAVQIEQVLTNLLENAAKYSPVGSRISVTATVTVSNTGIEEMRISVSDQGSGISPAEQSKIFDKFYRVSGPDRRIAGTGMGLAIVRGLVEAAGGRILVESVPGIGSTFSVVLPIESPAPLPAEGTRPNQVLRAVP